MQDTDLKFIMSEGKTSVAGAKAFCAFHPANRKMAELIMKDEHDFIIVYNGNYDAKMHKFGPESHEAIAELRSNTHTFVMLHDLIKIHWKHHNTFLGYGMDHGCHEIDGGCGSHGLNMEEDLNICHRYVGIPKGE